MRVVEWFRRDTRRGDGLLAGVLVVAALGELAETVPRAIAGGDEPNWFVVAFGVVGLTVPLIWRRRYPCTVATVVAAVQLVDLVPYNLHWPQFVQYTAASVVLYSVATHGGRRWPVIAAAAYIALAAPEVVYGSLGTEDTQWVAAGLVLLALPVPLGYTLRWMRRQHDAIKLRVEQLQAERADTARRAVFEERVRIARELHDVVAHHVSVMGVQAGAARLVLGSRPDQAAEVLTGIEQSSHRAMAELRQLLAYLRRAGEPADAARQPGLDQLPTLVASMRRASLDVEGTPVPVPRSVEVSAFRVVQEALTNVVKHSGGSTARVLVRHRPDELEIVVVDSGRGRTSKRAGMGGHGLVGMQERVALHGGHLRVGPRPAGGFEVLAAFPFEGARG
ncbi:sensor histidine kinase [Pseudonocardia sp. TRM90224]|uniref:sensor histidine kinase n=1 Tax=Pseudonocardia sp. TRM90224 TaxID=2812678 RepID=UPI001E45527E|nr:sensor histidine kinase [Pseudonocardia sp. TRM90224]